MKRTSLLCVIFLLSLTLVSAQEIAVLRDTYVAGETVQAYITNTTITTGQISLLNNQSNLVSITPLLVEYRDNQYLTYFDLSTSVTEGTYTLLAGALQNNFTITNGTQAVQIKPGIIILDKTESSFRIELENAGTTATVQITSSNTALKPRKSAISLNTEETKDLYVDYTYGNVGSDSAITLTYGAQSYTIPIIYPEEADVEENVTEEENITEEEPTVTEEVEAFIFLTTTTELNTTTNKSKSGPLKIQNLLNETIADVQVSVTGTLKDVLTSDETTISLGPNEIYSLYVSLNPQQNARAGTYEGEIIVSNAMYNASLALAVLVYEPTVEEVNATTLVENVTEEREFIEIEDLGEIQAEEGVSGTTVIGITLIVLLLAIFLLIIWQLRKREEKKFHEYIEETKRKK